MSSNIVGTYNVFEAARLARVDRVVFASSNHVVGMFEVDSGPSLYRLNDRRMIDHREEVRPDSLYGTSKVFGEALGRYYAEHHDMSVVCLRIGSVLPDDDPDGPSVAEGSGWLGLSVADRYRRLRATWLSQRDCGRLVASALDAEVGWAVVFGTSANPRQDLGPRTCPGGDRLRASGLRAGMAGRAATVKRLLVAGMKNVLILAALIAAYFAIVGILALARDETCDRLESERLAALQPGHDTPGPEYVYVRGMGTERSMLKDYLEAEAAMVQADCEEISR